MRIIAVMSPKGFTFHYVSILISGGKAGDQTGTEIYIPLCLYFNFFAKNNRVRHYKFTFHYVSILINHWDTNRQAVDLFTFHYVSILIPVPAPARCTPFSFTFHYVSILMTSYKNYQIFYG